MTATNQHKKPIPDFKSRQEMAEWFDTHDMTDYDFKPVKVQFDLEKPKEKTLILRLQEGFLERLKRRAKSKGLTLSSLARMWLIEMEKTQPAA